MRPYEQLSVPWGWDGKERGRLTVDVIPSRTPGLVLHRSTIGRSAFPEEATPPRWSPFSGWSVTHRHSGTTLVRYLPNLLMAERFARRMGEIIPDWSGPHQTLPLPENKADLWLACVESGAPEWADADALVIAP